MKEARAMLCLVCKKEFEPEKDCPEPFKKICPPCVMRLQLAAFTRNEKERMAVLIMSDAEIQEFMRTAVRRLFDYFDLESKGMTNTMKEIHKVLGQLDKKKKKKK
ncbi:unnamed protein product [marine sediment metagenome]|uniref:Uncharacterized protein n=1 Tax=marine sediment metagenome TaxID=412755 RepID=X1MZA8_9ZZZZ